MHCGFNCQCAFRFVTEKHKFYYIYQLLSLGLVLKLVITKGYGVLATTIEGQNAFGPTLYFV